MIPSLTIEQEGAVAELLKYSEAHGMYINRWALSISYALEVREGRGSDITIFSSDGEKILYALIDPYGRYSFNVGEVNWTCVPESDECNLCESSDN